MPLSDAGQVDVELEVIVEPIVSGVALTGRAGHRYPLLLPLFLLGTGLSLGLGLYDLLRLFLETGSCHHIPFILSTFLVICRETYVHGYV